MEFESTNFYSDPHFDHARMLDIRPEFKTIQDMNEGLIERFNKKVSPDSLTYLLGDISWTNPYPFLDRMNGHFIVIYGNHDKHISHPKIISIHKGYLDIKIEEQKVTLCHYPMISWNCSHYGAWHIYGHHHYHSDFGGKTMNVTADNLKYIPVSWEEVKKYMAKQPNNWDLLK